MRKILEVTAIVALSVLLLGALEFGVRAAERWRTGVWKQTRMASFYQRMGVSFDLYRPHAFLNTAPREGASRSAFGKRASFNSRGYRSPERSTDKPPGTLRVLAAGGSTTFDLLASDDATSWPWQLEALLAENLTATCTADMWVQGVEVWNAGFPGWTSVESSIALLVRDLALEPDIVVLFQGINDLQPASLSPSEVEYEQHAAQARLALGLDLPPLSWHDRSLLLERVRDVISGPLDPWRRISPADVVRKRALDPAAISVFEEHTRSFVALARSRGARVVLVTQTLRVREQQRERDQAYLNGWIPGLEASAAPAALEALNQVTRRLASEHPDILLVDAARDIDWHDRDFADAMHFSAEGSRKLAFYVAHQMADPTLLDAAACAGAAASSGHVAIPDQSSPVTVH